MFLGISLVKKAIKLNGGWVRLASICGKKKTS